MPEPRAPVFHCPVDGEPIIPVRAPSILLCPCHRKALLPTTAEAGAFVVARAAEVRV